MQNLEWYLADLKSTGKNTIETVEKSLTDMFIRLIRIYPCLVMMILNLKKTHLVAMYFYKLIQRVKGYSWYQTITGPIRIRFNALSTRDDHIHF